MTKRHTLIRISLSWLQLFSGIERPILEDVDTRLPFVPDCWIMGVRRSLNKLSASCNNCRYSTDIRHFGSHDQHIMQIACSSDDWSDSQLSDINHCRLFLGCVTLADIYTADGRRVHPIAYECSERKFRSSTHSLANTPMLQQPYKRWHGGPF